MEKNRELNFIELAKSKFPELDYSLVEYKGSKLKVKIICSIHGMFEQTPEHHLKGKGCPLCAKHIYTTEQIKKKLINPNYDYSLVEYTGFSNKVKILCKKCGKLFEQRISDHLNGCGCPYCNSQLFYTVNNFLNKANLIHGNKYDYSLVDYKNKKTKIKIICKKCRNIFEQTPNNHLSGYGCPYCCMSHGELTIEKWLKENNILFEKQKTFSDLKDKRLLSYDFYIPENNLLIEYNGIQHYKNIFGEKRLHLQKHHDWLKRKYAKNKGINLLTISYKDDIIWIMKKTITII
jgi:DNA-directed RNA polymerase subunit RPC12/RpoP